MNRIWTTVGAAGLVAVVTIACSTVANNHGHAGHHHHHQAKANHAEIFAAVTQAVAVMQPTEGSSTHGLVRFIQQGDQVRVTGRIEGLNANQEHGFHVHEYGDLTSNDGMATGGHYNPEGHDHGKPNGDERHAGDFGNLQADANGVAEFDFVVANLSVAGMVNPVIGRGLIVHRDRDDGSQPLGNAGPRIAQGVIGVANPGN